jgi:hypothetical protein
VRCVLALSLCLGCSSPSSSERSRPQPEKADAAPRDPVAAPRSAIAEVEPAVPDGPHITLSLLGRYRDPSFGAIDLPAVSADGQQIAFVRELEDGGRGNPNLSLVIRSIATGRDLDVIEVLAPEPLWSPDREAAVRARLVGANRRLAAGRWKPMTRPRYDEAAIDGKSVTLEVGKLTVRARGDRLEIARGRQVVARKQLSSWLGAGDTGCRTSPQLRDASAANGLALLEFGFTGPDGCWREPQRRIIRL